MSDRERTVLLLAAEGLTDKEIAKHLSLSQRTIGTYWERMRLKLGPYSRTQLVARFLRVESADEGSNYRSLFATWEEGVWILSPYGATIYANHRIAMLFGFTAEEFRQSDARTILSSATGQPLEELIASAQKGVQTREFLFQRQDGSAVWLRMSVSAVTDPRGRCSAVVLLLSDTSIQKRLKRALDSCESTLAFLSEHSTDLIARFDPELTCIAINPRFLDVLGRQKDEVVGRAIHELAEVFRPLPDWVAHLRSALDSGSSQSFPSACIPNGPRTYTHLLQEPSPDFKPGAIFSITTVGGEPPSGPES